MRTSLSKIYDIHISCKHLHCLAACEIVIRQNYTKICIMDICYSTGFFYQLNQVFTHWNHHWGDISVSGHKVTCVPNVSPEEGKFFIPLETKEPGSCSSHRMDGLRWLLRDQFSVLAARADPVIMRPYIGCILGQWDYKRTGMVWYGMTAGHLQGRPCT